MGTNHCEPQRDDTLWETMNTSWRFRSLAFTALSTIAFACGSEDDLAAAPDAAADTSAGGADAGRRDAGATETGSDTNISIQDASDSATSTDSSDSALPKDGGNITCEAGTGNCDHATFNGCETDIRNNLEHCGACGVVCDGWCRDGKCTRFEVLADEEYNTTYDWGGIAFRDNDVYWLSSSSADQNAETYRLRKASKTGAGATSLASNFARLWQLVAGSQQLYFNEWGTGPLYSINIDGTKLAEFTPYLGGHTYSGLRVYWATNYNGTAILSSKHTVTQLEETVYQVPNSVWTDEQLGQSLVPDNNGSVFFSEYSHGTYKILRGRQLTPIAQGSGYVFRMRYDNYYLYWSAGGIWRCQPGNSTPTLVGGQGVAIYDFVVDSDEDYLYYSWQNDRTSEYGLSVISRPGEASSTIELSKGYAPTTSLELDSTHLYFFDQFKHRLVRVPKLRR